MASCDLMSQGSLSVPNSQPLGTRITNQGHWVYTKRLKRSKIELCDPGSV